MTHLTENAEKSKPRVRIRKTEKPDSSRSKAPVSGRGEGARRRDVQAAMDADRTPVQRQGAKAGRKTTATKARRSEAWWNKRFMGPEYNFFYRNFLSRCMRTYLAPTEWAVLDFIFDRTLGWDKEWERISVRQFFYGSKPNEQGFQAFCGIGIQSETTLREALKTLVRYKLIQVKEHEGGSRSFSLTRLDYLADEIAKMNLPEGTEIRYGAKWPKQGKYIEICSNVTCSQ